MNFPATIAFLGFRLLAALTVVLSFGDGHEAVAAQNSVAVVLVEVEGIETGLSESAVSEIFFGTRGVSARFQETSYGQFSLKHWNPGKALTLGPVVIAPKSGETCDSSYRKWSDRAIEMLGPAGRQLSNIKHVVFLFPPADLLGCSVRARGELFGTKSWIFVPAVNTILHEIGHNIGLAHSGVGSSIKIDSEYGDRSSPMGFPVEQRLFLNAAELLQLGWLGSPSVQTITQRGTHLLSLGSLELGPGGPNPLVIRLQTPAPRRTFTLSFRALESSAVAGMRVFHQGVSVHLDRGVGNGTVLVKTLRDGESYFDPGTGLQVIQLSHEVDSVQLKVVMPSSEFTPLPAPGNPPAQDSDNDGVRNDSDCAPADPSSWSALVSVDADGDGISDSNSTSGGCAGENPGPGTAFLGEFIDNCPAFPSANMRDADRNGVGDVCSSDFSISYNSYTTAALARQVRHSLLAAQRAKSGNGFVLALSVAQRLLGNLKQRAAGFKEIASASKLIGKAKSPKELNPALQQIAAFMAKKQIPETFSETTAALISRPAAAALSPCKLNH